MKAHVRPSGLPPLASCQRVSTTNSGALTSGTPRATAEAEEGNSGGWGTGEPAWGRVAARLAQAPASSISAACGGWAESMAAYRLLNAPEVTPGAILAPHRRALLARAATVPCVLVIQGYDRGGGRE